MDELLAGLTDEQRAAVTHGAGPCLVIAGAGTGKTRVLTQRIAYLVASGQTTAERVIALTFTEKAATEMQERVDELLPLGQNAALISTFHSFTTDILRRHAHYLGIPADFTLLTKEEEIVFLREHLFELPLKMLRPSQNPTRFLSDIAGFFNRLNDQALTDETLEEWTKTRLADEDPVIADRAAKLAELTAAHQVYEKLLRDFGYLTFGHCITETIKLFREHPSLLDNFRQQFSHVLVDEYQDTNWAQTELVSQLAGQNGNVMVVGDDDQSIYSFRGAASRNLIEFRERFPNTTVIVLRHNFRSTQAILDAAYRLIQQNNPERLEFTEKVDKRLLAQSAGEPPRFTYYATLSGELAGVAEQVNRWLDDKIPPQEIGILCRTYQQTQQVERVLHQAGVPVNRHQSEPLFEVPLIRGIIGFLRLLAKTDDNLAVTELFTRPPFAVPGPIWQKICEARPYKEDSLWQSIIRLVEEPPVWLTDGVVRRLSKAISLYQELAGKLNEPASYVFLQFVHKSGLYEKLTKSKRPAAEVELAQLGQLYDEMQAYEERHRRTTLEQFLHYLEVLVEIGQEVPTSSTDQADPFAVNILTVHKSKGLEFTAVIVPFCVQGRFPSKNYAESLPLPDELDRARGHDGHLNEERRLFYVALTRAKTHLVVSAAERYGQVQRQKVSPFVYETFPDTELQELTPVSVPAADYLQAQLDLPETPAVLGPARVGTLHRLSYSPLETDLKGPWKYRYQYVLRLRSLPNQVMTVGIIVHQVLEGYAQAKLRGMETNMAELLERYWTTAGFESRTQERQRYAEALRAVEGAKAELDAAAIQATEESIEFIMPNGQRFTSKIDRLDLLPDGRLAIVDYKTGHPTTEVEAKQNLQLGLYILAVENRHKKEVATVNLYYVMEGEKVSVARDQFALEAVAQQVMTGSAALEANRQSNTFVATPSHQACTYCDYRHLCPFRYTS